METNATNETVLEAVIDHFTVALRSGMKPSIRDYQQQHPELADEIAEVLNSILMIEQFKSASDSSQSSRRLLDELAELKQIGPYRITGQIGRGGMGLVFAAVHLELGHQVAIKVMPTRAADDQSIQRFQLEGQTAACLHHTNIVSVFAAGQETNFYYYVMDYVDGESLDRVIVNLREASRQFLETSGSRVISAMESERAASYVNQYRTNRFRWSAEIAAQMAEAVDYAHGAGILHRDLKPANMILDRAGRIWLTDFGLAKDFNSDAALTKTGDILGTPQYLPPESLDGQYDHRSDIYGIGLVLYEMIALQPAYSGSSTGELLRAIANRTPQSIRKLVADIPVDLQTIVEKAIGREPAARYQTASQLSRDLRAYLEDRPVAARRPGILETWYRWAKRNPLIATLSLTSAILLMLVTISASTGYLLTTTALRNEAAANHKLRHQQAETEEARQQAESNLQQMKVHYDRAESNVALTMRAFDEMFKHLISRGSNSTITQDIEGLRELSGIENSLTADDARFLDRMLLFYEKFAAQNAENESLKTESARAYRRVGNIYQIVGQFQPAIDAYQQSIDLLPTIPAENRSSQSLEDLLTRVRIQNELSSAYRQMGALAKAQEWNQRSIRLLESEREVNNVPALTLELARTKIALGFEVLRSYSNTPKSQLRSGTGDRPALEISRRMWERVNKPLIFDAIKLLEGLLRDDPDNGESIAVLASCYWCLAAADLPRDQANGFENRNKALELLEIWANRDPDNAELKYLQALACSLTLPDADESEHALVERGAALASQLIDAFPSVLDYHHLHAKLRTKLAGYHIQHSQLDQAFEQLQTAKRSMLVLVHRASTDRTFSLTIAALIRELWQLEKLYREAGSQRQSNEVHQILRQFQQRRL